MILFRKLLLRLTMILMAAALPFALLQAQTNANSPYVPNIIPASPNAAALMKFSDVPVSPYTGTTDITVPIYTIQARGITVPISVSYHTAGIKLEEEASWVGLGWAMNAGGMISRTIMGSDDFGTQGPIYLTNLCPQYPGDFSGTQPAQVYNEPQILSNYFFDFYCNYQVTTSAGTEDLTPAFSGGGGNVYDMEPDIFSYNFPGHSGKFILTRLGNVVMQKQENIKIQFQGGGSAVTFTVTDDQGNSFYFNVPEQIGNAGRWQTSSWLLSKIVTQQRDSVLFNYVTGGTTASSTYDINQTYGSFCTALAGGAETDVEPPLYNNQTLQSIDFSNGHIQFATDANRSDLEGGYKLDSVMVYSKNAAGVQTYLKQDNFYYSYFNPTYAPISSTPMEYYRLRLDSVKEKSGTFSLPPYAFMYNNPDPGAGSNKHGYAVDHWGYYNGTGTNQGTFIPKVSYLYNPMVNEQGGEQMFSYPAGANREPDPASMQTFSLQQVTYPTGGKTVLTYQPNDYDYINSEQAAQETGGGNPFQNVLVDTVTNQITMTSHGLDSGNIDLRNIYPIITPPQPNVTIHVAFRYLENGSTPYQNQAGQIWFSFGTTTLDISSATCEGNVCTLSATVLLYPDSVNTWTAHIASGIDTVNTFAGIYASIRYPELQQTINQSQSNYILPASGLRISNVTNYTNAGTIASEKVYSYTYLQDKLNTGTPQQYTYGRLMAFPTYARYAITASSQGGYCTALCLFGSSISSLTSTVTGNIVGYDQVTETSVNPVTGQDIGKTVYNYFNSPDTPVALAGYDFPGMLNMGNNLNGLLLSKVDYADNAGVYTPVAETDNFYHTANRTVYFSPKFQFATGKGGKSGCSNNVYVTAETLAAFYPSIKSERVLLDSTRHISYQEGDATKFVASTQADYYDNPIHYQLTRSRTIDSKGDTLITLLKYPQDYIPSGNIITHNTILDSMIGRNMVSETIEKQDSLYYPGSSAGYITGAELSLYRILTGNNNTVVPDRSYKLGIQSPITNFTPFSISGNTTSLDSRNRQMVSFDQYDGNNNLQQYTTTDLNPVSIIWDYVGKYPIAQVKNAVITDVAATSFEADGYGNWSPFTGVITTVTTAPFPPTGNRYYNLTTSATLSKSGLVSGNTYIVSYWSQNGAYSISGGTGTSISGKTINGWTYYEHTITASSATLTISGTGSIDEVRLYPANAQMTTYTFSPLTGMTTQCDVDNRVTYYFYDGLGRLMYVKDQDGNIMKTYQYHYLNSTTQY
jgi:hypothetical protein